jgi:hypothetical protein
MHFSPTHPPLYKTTSSPRLLISLQLSNRARLVWHLVFPSKNRSLLREWNTGSSALGFCKGECSYISLAYVLQSSYSRAQKRDLLVVSSESQVVRTQISTSPKKVLSPQRQATSVEAQALLAKLSVKQVAAQAGRPVKFWERTEVAARARAAMMVENCILGMRWEFDLE